MLGKIININDNVANINLSKEQQIDNLMNMHIVFEDGIRRIVGEVEEISEENIKARFLGEFEDNKFMIGVVRKPSMSSKIRLITNDELELLVGKNTKENLLIGTSPLYENCPIYVDINKLFSNHMAIFGNTGSGKSCGFSRFLQNLFKNPNYVPYRSNFLIFDAYGEYHNAFKNLKDINPQLNFKYYTTNVNDKEGELIKIPIWLLDVDSFALILQATEHSQLPIIERMLKLVRIFSESSEQAIKYKNHLIAKAIMTILYTNQTATSKRNDIFQILATCSTKEFNTESLVQGVGYTRKFRECFTIDKTGSFTDSILVTNYISSFINDELENYESTQINPFTLEDLEKALSFTLISEGLLNNEQTYSDAVTLKVRLHSLVVGENAKYFRCNTPYTLENYIISLLLCKDGKKAQIINFNLEDIDDTMAKTITKIFSKMLFDFTKGLKVRASVPFHIFLEEAHRYVQDDNDKFLLGYNIFERISKEGRKFGLIFNLISQRPVEINEGVISQCNNFIMFKMNHPRDLEYIEKMLPNINPSIVSKLKSLNPGTCVAFGKAFTIPMIVKVEMPNPEPSSGNSDVYERWKV